jgi:diguanylate cyclase (GGDEF)-like protein/PAS domain S-box-containing protein
VWTTDPRGRFTYLNNAARDIFGLSPRDLNGRCFFDFEAGNAHIGNRRFLALLKRNGEVKNYVTHVVTLRGEDRWIGINARILLDDNHQIMGIRGTARDITEQHLANQRIEYLAMHDSLTDLPNRIALQKQVIEGLESTKPGALLFLDIDHFKYVNDNFGHHTGDQMIKGVGSALRGMMRDVNGGLFRLGGDEFAIHLPGSLRQEAMQVAERALETVQHYRFQGYGSKGISNLSASIGIALYPFHGDNIAGLLSNVDIAMYRAKGQGRNRYALFDERRGKHAQHAQALCTGQRSCAMRSTTIGCCCLRSLRCASRTASRCITRSCFASATRTARSSCLRALSRSRKRWASRRSSTCAWWKSCCCTCISTTEGKKVRYCVNLSRVSISDQKLDQSAC